tara:strand:- start:1729 stop:2181 length:453 start_codon:yes stop_codon:yes gene_type:complete
MKKFLFVFILFLTSCGYESVNKLDKLNYTITKYEFTGNQQVNKILKKNFNRLQNDKVTSNEFEIFAKSDLIKSNNSKNQAGEVTNLTLKIIVDFEIFKNNQKIKKISLTESTNYNSDNNKFEQKQFEKILIKNLVDKIIKQINLNLLSIE